MNDSCYHWREMALRHLQGCDEAIKSATSHVDMWWSLKELACETDASQLCIQKVDSIFRYAWWCVAESGDERLAAEVQAYFYEDLPVYDDLAAKLPLYITPFQFERLQSCFHFRLANGEYATFRSRYYVERDRMSSQEEQGDRPEADGRSGPADGK